MSNRNGNIDLVKCLASLLVMACHLNIFGITIESNHFLLHGYMWNYT